MLRARNLLQVEGPVTCYGCYQGSGLSEEQEFLKGQIEAADYASSLAKFFCALLDMHTCKISGVWVWGLGGRV